MFVLAILISVRYSVVCQCPMFVILGLTVIILAFIYFPFKDKFSFWYLQIFFCRTLLRKEYSYDLQVWMAWHCYFYISSHSYYVSGFVLLICLTDFHIIIDDGDNNPGNPTFVSEWLKPSCGGTGKFMVTDVCHKRSYIIVIWFSYQLLIVLFCNTQNGISIVPWSCGDPKEILHTFSLFLMQRVSFFG